MRCFDARISVEPTISHPLLGRVFLVLGIFEQLKIKVFGQVISSVQRNPCFGSCMFICGFESQFRLRLNYFSLGSLHVVQLLVVAIEFSAVLQSVFEVRLGVFGSLLSGGVRADLDADFAGQSVFFTELVQIQMLFVS